MDHWILPDLIVFLEVVRAGSLTKAATRLHTVQSTVSARIRRLEAEAHTALLKRHARGIAPTPAGEAVLALAVRTQAVLDDLRLTCGRGSPASRGPLRLGSIETAAASHLPALVSRFTRLHPTVDVSVETGSSASLLKLLRRGELDAVFVSRGPGLPGFQEKVAFLDELTVVVPAAVRSWSHLLADRKKPLAVLVQRLGCSYTERLLTHLADEAPQGHLLRQLGTLEGVLGFVEAGAGIAAMPRAFAHAAGGRRALRQLPLPAKLARLETYLVAPAPAECSSVLKDLVNLCAKPRMRG